MAKTVGIRITRAAQPCHFEFNHDEKSNLIEAIVTCTSGNNSIPFPMPAALVSLPPVYSATSTSTWSGGAEELLRAGDRSGQTRSVPIREQMVKQILFSMSEEGSE